jgi:hypothetical protein
VPVSSTFLYLAIVAVWAVVLVPMWLRRDTEATTFSRILHRRGSSDLDATLEEDPIEEFEDDEASDPSKPSDIPTEERSLTQPHAPSHRRRAAVIARRRRRTAGLVLLVILASAATAAGFGPWWIVLPPAGLLVGHLSLLRVAAGMDAAHRRELHEARLAAARQRLRAQAEAEARRLAEEDAAAHAEIIDLSARTRDVFDQYADDTPASRRAVGD